MLIISIIKNPHSLDLGHKLLLICLTHGLSLIWITFGESRVIILFFLISRLQLGLGIIISLNLNKLQIRIPPLLLLPFSSPSPPLSRQSNLLILNISAKSSQIFTTFWGKLPVGIQQWLKQKIYKSINKQTNKQTNK